MKKFIICILASIIFLYGFSLKTFSMTVKESSNAYTASFPAGTMLKVLLQEKISSEVNNVGDIVEFIVPNDYNYRGINYIQQNTKIYGKIIKLQRAEPGRNGLLLIMIYKMTQPESDDQYIVGHIWTKSTDGVLGGELTPQVSFRKVPHRIQNIGTILQYVPDGARQMGKAKELLPGSEVIIVLDQQLQISVPKNQ